MFSSRSWQPVVLSWHGNPTDCQTMCIWILGPWWYADALWKCHLELCVVTNLSNSLWKVTLHIDTDVTSDGWESSINSGWTRFYRFFFLCGRWLAVWGRYFPRHAWLTLCIKAVLDNCSCWILFVLWFLSPSRWNNTVKTHWYCRSFLSVSSVSVIFQTRCPKTASRESLIYSN